MTVSGPRDPIRWWERALRMPWSFRRQIVVLTAATTAVAMLLLALVLQVVLARITVNDLDRVLDDRAESVVAAITTTSTGPTITVPDIVLDPGVAVFDASGRVVAGYDPGRLAPDYDKLASATSPVSVEARGDTRLRALPFDSTSKDGTALSGVVVVSERVDPYEQSESLALIASLVTGALATLAAAGVELDRSALDLVEPRLRAEEPSFDAFWGAVGEGRPVRFDYRRSPGDAPTTRRLEPWGVVRSSGRWYVAGRDRDRGEPRVFRLSRVVGDVAPDGEPGEVVVPPGTEVGQLTRNLAPPSPGVPATVLVRSGAGLGLRRAAERTETGVAGPDGTADWDRLSLPDSGSEVADEVLAHGPDAVVESPPELRDSVVRRLREALATTGTTDTTETTTGATR